jgi:hypothetical protein
MLDGRYFWVVELGGDKFELRSWRDGCTRYSASEVDHVIMQLSFDQPRLEFAAVEVLSSFRLNKGTATLLRSFDWEAALKQLYEG